VGPHQTRMLQHNVWCTAASHGTSCVMPLSPEGAGPGQVAAARHIMQDDVAKPVCPTCCGRWSSTALQHQASRVDSGS
jgi:hypothetical protein